LFLFSLERVSPWLNKIGIFFVIVQLDERTKDKLTLAQLIATDERISSTFTNNVPLILGTIALEHVAIISFPADHIQCTLA